MKQEPVALRYDFDGYGYQYMDSGSGSDWLTRVDGELLYTHPAKTLTDEEIAELKNARDYWCLQYKDVFSKFESLKYWQDTWRPFLKEHFGVDK
jgi:hypothetical protein